MKKGRVVNLNFIGGAVEFTLKNKILLLVTLFFLIGLTLGVILFGKYDLISEYISNYLTDFINHRNNPKFLNIFIDSFFESVLFILLSFCIGTSMFGTVLILPLIIFKSFFYGSFVSYLYLQYGIKGIAYNAVIVLPYSIFFIIAFLLSVCCSINFSILLANQTFYSGEYRNISQGFKNYCIKHIFILFLILISALIDALISINFTSNFKL